MARQWPSNLAPDLIHLTDLTIQLRSQVLLTNGAVLTQLPLRCH